MLPSDPYETWMQKKWRPMMGWLYMTTCAFDFIIFPIVWSATQALMHHQVTQWDPLTLRGAGFYHLAMGAVLGVAAWTRGQEKIAFMNNFGMPTSQPVSQDNTQTQVNTGPRFSSKPSARTIIPENPNLDADPKIR